ncbi:MAG: nitrophenyl compound nitroreductase subunit ArsF family protein [Candidatus Moranbacteria bacterium]|nr:nitrophenyl compound nitroreductase subunit ArsF family protein [Candidatus Moranbacteria bacterium]
MKKIAIIILLFVSMSGVLSGCTTSDENKTYYFDKDGNMTTVKPSNGEAQENSVGVADILEVYYFHSSQRCYACEAAGEYISSLINEKYSQELEEGGIVFGQINVDLRENKELARKFEATGSSLYFNRIIDGQDNIEQETRIWRLLNSENQFKEYLEEKIDSYLGL